MIGYDLINEPFMGNAYFYPWLLLSGWADYYNLQPMYENVAEAIRQEDDEKIIFIEPWQGDSSYQQTGFT